MVVVVVAIVDGVVDGTVVVLEEEDGLGAVESVESRVVDAVSAGRSVVSGVSSRRERVTRTISRSVTAPDSDKSVLRCHGLIAGDTPGFDHRHGRVSGGSAPGRMRRRPSHALLTVDTEPRPQGSVRVGASGASSRPESQLFPCPHCGVGADVCLSYVCSKMRHCVASWNRARPKFGLRNV